MKTDSPPTHTIMRVLILACMVAASYGAAINCFVGVKGDATTPWASKACADKEVCQTTTVTTTAKAAAKTETAVTTGACAAEDTANDKAKNTCAAAVAGATWVLDTTDGVSTTTCRPYSTIFRLQSHKYKAIMKLRRTPHTVKNYWPRLN